MNRSKERNRARSLSALVEELEDEEDEDLLVLKKFPSEKKNILGIRKNILKVFLLKEKKSRPSCRS